MGKYVLKRIAMMLLMLLGMTFIVFASLYFAPGDPAEIAAGPSATQEEIELTWAWTSPSGVNMAATSGGCSTAIWEPPC